MTSPWRIPGIAVALLLCWGLGCGPTTRCGPGTELREGLCVPIKAEPSASDAAPDVPATRPDSPRGPEPEPAAETKASEKPTEAGPGRTGESCSASKPCAVGPCLKEGYCTAPCTKDDQCPVGMTCREINHKQADGSYKTFTGCVRPPEKPKTCRSDADCPSHQSCVTTLSPNGDAVVQVCANSIPGGKATGEACDPPKGIQCRNTLCLNDTFCSALCTDASQCPKDWACDPVTITLPNGKSAKINACTPGRKPCDRDKDCPDGTICRSFLNKDQTGLDFLCASPDKKGAQAGAACDVQSQSRGCYNFMCIDAGFCLAICKEDADCPEGFTCQDVDAALPKGKVKFKGCVVKSQACERDADCAKGLTCQLLSNAAQDKITPFCGIRRLDTLAAGVTCVPGSQKASEQCSNNMCLSHGYCSALCKDDKDCPKDFTCTPLTVELPNNPNAQIQGCVKKTP